MSEFVERLEELMFEHGLNKKMLAQKAHINATCISHYLLEKRFPTLESLVKLADFFYLNGHRKRICCFLFKPGIDFVGV